MSSHLKLIGDRWTLHLLLELDDVRGARFDALAAAEGLSRRVLTERLRALEDAGLVVRRRYNARPPRFDYLLTPRGMRAQRHAVELERAVAGAPPIERVAPASTGDITAPSTPGWRAGRQVVPPAATASATGGNGVVAPDAHPADALLAGDPARAREIFDATIAPLVRYDRQYATQLVETLETYLAADASTAVAAARLFAHRHTVRYRLGRVHELCGLDVEVQVDREQLGLGLRAWRLFGEAWRLT